MVREAVEQLRGAPTDKPIQPRVEIGVDAYLPEDQDGLTRISLYQRIARVASSAEIESIGQEMEDRFGPVPVPAQMLMKVTELGFLAGRLRIQGLQQRKGVLVATFAENPPPDPRRLLSMCPISPYPMRLLNVTPVQAVIELGTVEPEKVAERALECFRIFSEDKV